MSLPDTLTISPSVLYFGTPVALVGTADSHANANISPVSSLWALGQTIVLGLGTTGCALANLREREECTINLPSVDLWPKVEAIARTTGSSPWEALHPCLPRRSGLHASPDVLCNWSAAFRRFMVMSPEDLSSST
ncbi:flavin reductase [Gluconobacter sp. P5E10]|uniref:flavin reductase n=1 Tax=Gluconobacter sp. P5E10 TaxID=2762613 RepID=UPI00207B7EC4|nr:flavin reductase [Gluconobacter sp. P5E10]